MQKVLKFQSNIPSIQLDFHKIPSVCPSIKDCPFKTAVLLAKNGSRFSPKYPKTVVVFPKNGGCFSQKRWFFSQKQRCFFNQKMVVAFLKAVVVFHFPQNGVVFLTNSITMAIFPKGVSILNKYTPKDQRNKTHQWRKNKRQKIWRTHGNSNAEVRQ